MIDRVTVTGADDSIDPMQLISLTERFPFVEWGILLSKSAEGAHRFPSLPWMERLAELPTFRLSGHLCGFWVRELCAGRLTFAAERPTIAALFQRVQLNFHAMQHLVVRKALIAALASWGRDEYIFQFDGVNNGLMDTAHSAGVKVAPLFDTSGGAGVEPEVWPKPLAEYCGYAGGLHPDRLEGQLSRIFGASQNARIWIDVESHVRSNNNSVFDLRKVERFLETAGRFVTPIPSVPATSQRRP